MSGTLPSNLDVMHLIHCTVCSKIYEKPHALKCLHTFCHKCLPQTGGDFKVKCPVCKLPSDNYNIRPDFRTESLVNAYNNSQKQDKANKGEKTKPIKRKKSLCESCFLSGNDLTHKCETCDRLLCETCADTHFQMKQDSKCPSHIVKPVETIVDNIQENINKSLSKLAYIKKKYEETMTKVTKGIAVTDAGMGYVMSKITSRETEVTKAVCKAVELHHKNLREIVKDKHENQIEMLKESYKTARASVQTLESQEQFLRSFTGQTSDELLSSMYTISNLVAEIQDADVEPDKGIQYSFTANVSGDIPDITSITRVSFASSEDRKSQPISLGAGNKLKKTISLESIGKRDYKFHKCYDVGVICLTQLVKDDLYCFDNSKSSKINILSKEFELLKSIDINAAATGFFKTESGYFIITSNTGVSVHDSDGKELQLIKQGSFFGVFVYMKKIYAYEKNENKVFIFSQNESSWNHEDSILLNYQEVTAKLPSANIINFQMVDDTIYLLDITRMYKFDLKGDLLMTYTCDPIMGNPRMCQVDSEGTILVADRSHKRVILFDSDGDRCTLNCRGGDKWHAIFYAMMTEDKNTLYVSHNSSGRVKLSMFQFNDLPQIL